ncbi:hypothetical protein AVEN_161171-1 [Araneus ventricosus]|uniref:Uncharacterized protein n=1 Tax=Araneus ventricosus TaxID=182803 RepID=A0A4Y2U992_ARAVE|nr:hypothetical protein AVEN_161171-1 [Araneus ventricosus]
MKRRETWLLDQSFTTTLSHENPFTASHFDSLGECLGRLHHSIFKPQRTYFPQDFRSSQCKWRFVMKFKWPLYATPIVSRFHIHARFRRVTMSIALRGVAVNGRP